MHSVAPVDLSAHKKTCTHHYPTDKDTPHACWHHLLLMLRILFCSSVIISTCTKFTMTNML